MIGKLSGIVDYRAKDHVLIDVRGVGYIVYCSERTLMALPGNGEPVALYTELLVREDNLQLFGFQTLLEREWHRLLISVQGIGAKASLSILSALGAEGIGRAIALGDWNAVKAAQGVGPKIAQRVVNELKDKAPEVMAIGGTLSHSLATMPVTEDVVIEPAAPISTPAPQTGPGDLAGALSALVNLGYGQGEAAAAVAQAAQDGVDGEADLIRAALKALAPIG